MGSYNAKDHRKAFDWWLKTRNLSEVARRVGANWETVKNWSTNDFACQWACPWHDWDTLVAEEDRVHQARLVVLNKHNADPVMMDHSIRAAAAAPTQIVDTDSSYKRPSIRPIAERIAHWEYLWAKAFFDATGQVTDWQTFRNLGGDPDIENQLRQALRSGLHCTSLEQAVRTLKMIQDQIERCLNFDETLLPQEDDHDDVTLDDLREMRAQLRVLPSKKSEPSEQVVTPKKRIPPPPPPHASTASG